MNDYKKGDEVYFFYTNFGNKMWGKHDTIIYPSETTILTGIIVKIDEERDCVHLYVDGCTSILEMGLTFFDDVMFRSKRKAIDAMIIRLEGL